IGAMTLAVLAVYVTKRFKHGFIFGAIALCISMAVYQSTVGLTAGLSVAVILFEFLKKQDIKALWQKSWQYIAMGAGGVSLYLISVKISSIFAPLSTYKGINNMGAIDLAQLPHMLNDAATSFIRYYVTDLNYAFP